MNKNQLISQKENLDHYQFPRYLGLNSSKISSDLIELELGYSRRLKKNIKIDSEVLSLIKYCFKPKTKSEIINKFKISEVSLNKLLKNLTKEGLLTNQVEKNTPTNFQRYDRHLLYYQTLGFKSVEVQERLSKSKVALIGMGGIGNWVALNLIGAGLKEIKLIDYDKIELSNLTRQVLFDEKSIGKSKAKEAQKILSIKNSLTRISVVDLKVDGVDALKKALKGFDMVVLSADKPQYIHDWVDEVCYELNIAYINLGYRDGEGVIGPMTIPDKTSCYQCFKPKVKTTQLTEEQKLYLNFDDRYQAPSYGPINSMVSSIGSMEVLNYLGRTIKPHSQGVELSIDPVNLKIHKTKYKRDEECWHCGKK